MKPRLTIVRGIPGSGKTHHVLEIIEKKYPPHSTRIARPVSNDDFYGNNYHLWSKQSVFWAAQWCQGQAAQALLKGYDTFVHNTFIYIEHILPYIRMAKNFGVDLYITRPDTEWRSNWKECAKRCTHNVPAETIKRMAEEFEPLRWGKWEHGL